MNSDVKLERLVRPSDLRRRRGVFGTIADFVVQAINAIIT